MSDEYAPRTDPACSACLTKDQEIQRLRLQVDQLQQAAVTDPLTQVHNKVYFNGALRKELERTRRSQQPTSLILLDIDHFKHINDSYGHLSGDLVLHSLGQILKNMMRIIDIPCRFGGEEFALILPATNIDTAVQVAERLREGIEQTRLSIKKGREVSITVSLGVSCYQVEDGLTSEDELLERADQQLYLAKQLGRNRVSAETVSTLDDKFEDELERNKSPEQCLTADDE